MTQVVSSQTSDTRLGTSVPSAVLATSSYRFLAAFFADAIPAETPDE